MNKLDKLLEMARDKAEYLYNTRNIFFPSNMKSWEECIQVEEIKDLKHTTLYFNVGPNTHIVSLTSKIGKDQ